jgi:hypothetical protein
MHSRPRHGCILPAVDRFPTFRDAKEYLIRRILVQADRDGVSLSDVERKMLYFSETGWTLPDMMFVSRVFDQNYDQNEYETKIGQIVRRIHHQPDGNRDDDHWDEAVQRRRDEDHYLTVLIDGASNRPVKISRWEMVGVFMAGGAIVAVVLPISFFVWSHVDNPALQKLIIGSAFLAPAVLVAFLLSRRHRDSA